MYWLLLGCTSTSGGCIAVRLSVDAVATADFIEFCFEFLCESSQGSTRVEVASAAELCVGVES